MTGNPKSAGEGSCLRRAISEWIKRYPLGSIVLVSLVAVCFNCYPVLFCGRSFVSPECIGKIVYQDGPSLPGMKNRRLYDPHGSDVGAMMWGAVPMGFIESRAILEHGEIPLWNRYGHCGDTLIGQAISMLGDPLQLVVILGHGAAVAWDIKFIIAKWLFAAGFALLILRLLKNVYLALLFAVMAVYCGAFFYIYIHPAFFVFSYSPWILLSAIEFLSPGNHRWHWAAIWFISNIGCFCAGHIEVAVDLIAGMNLAAVAYALILAQGRCQQFVIVTRMAIMTALFLGLTAPVWLSFLSSLDGAFSIHSDVRVTQLSPALFPGVFDDLFYMFSKKTSDPALGPGCSLLVFTGVLLSIFRWRQFQTCRFFWINIAAVLLWGGFVFGWIPAILIESIPLWNKVGHVHTDFSYLLVIHLMIQSAFGFQALAAENKFMRSLKHLLCVAIGIVLMMVVYCCFVPHSDLPAGYFAVTGIAAVGAPLLYAYLRQLHQRLPLTGWAQVIVLGIMPQFRFGLYDFGNDKILLVAGHRETLNAKSPSVEKIRADHNAPFRVVGLRFNFLGDYEAVYALEDIRSCVPLSNHDYIELVRTFPGMRIDEDWMINITDPVKAHPLLNLLNVKYLLGRTNVVLDPRFKFCEQGDFYRIENLDVWPRAFFCNAVIPVSSTWEFSSFLIKNGQKPFVAMDVKEMLKAKIPDAARNVQEPIVMEATHYDLRANSTAFDIEAPSAGVVCLLEGQAKNFTATANNQPVPVLTVNRAFKGIYLGKGGNWHVVFTYRPAHWYLAWGLFWGAAGMALVFLCFIAVRRWFLMELDEKNL